MAAASLRPGLDQLIPLKQVGYLQKVSMAVLPQLQLKMQLGKLLRKVLGMEVVVQLGTQLEVLLGIGLGMLLRMLYGMVLVGMLMVMLLHVLWKTLLAMLVVLGVLAMGSLLWRMGLLGAQEEGQELSRAITLSCWCFAVLLLLPLHAMQLVHVKLKICLWPSLLASWILSESLLGAQSPLWYWLSSVQHFAKQIQHPLSQL